MTTDATWIESSVARWERPLIAYAKRFLGNDNDARDIVQEAFLRLCRQPRATVEQRLVEWLFTVVRNCAIDHLRKERHMHTIAELHEPESAEASPREQLETQEKYNQLLTALSSLPPNQQECIRLKFQQQLSYQQISSITGLSVTNVGYLIHVGIKALREQIAPACEGKLS